MSGENLGKDGARGKRTSLGLERMALDIWRREAVGLQLLPHLMGERSIGMSPIHGIDVLEKALGVMFGIHLLQCH